MFLAAGRKGISLLGTGDFAHPAWRKELEEKLCAAEDGLFQLKKDLQASLVPLLPPLCSSFVRWILQVELSTVYSEDGRTRKIHHLVFVPDFASVDRLMAKISPFGALASDGRPTLSLNARNLLEIVLEVHPDAFLIPAHIWTPFFSVLGSRSRFPSIDACYKDLSSHLFAVETGLSSDPPMNWQVSSLDRFQLISTSDAHSPAKIGRKASIFASALSFHGIRRALATGIGFEGTIELYPEEGKYFLDGHRKCGFSCRPDQTHALQGRCPKCTRPLTLGVVHRLEEVADRQAGVQRPSAKPRTYVIPLLELLSEVLEVGPATRAVCTAYDRTIHALGSEIDVLLNISLDRIRSVQIPHLAEAIANMRKGIVVTTPGFDGQYGAVRVRAQKPLTGVGQFRYQQQEDRL